MNLNRFKQLLESQMGNVKPLISEQINSGETKNFKFQIITNDWKSLPTEFKGYLMFDNWIELRSHLIPNGAQIRKYYMENKSTLTADAYLSYVSGDIIYLITLDKDNGQLGAGDCTVERGTAKEYNDFYGNGKAPHYNVLPQGSTEYMIIVKNEDKNRSLLGVLKSGTSCWNFLFNKFSTQYGNLSDCWTT